MVAARDLPEIAFVRVLTPGGPYTVGAMLSVAFVSPGVGRLAEHGTSIDLPQYGGDRLVPDTISAFVVRAAGPYAAGSSLTLSFIDPSIARIHESATGDLRDASATPPPAEQERWLLDDAAAPVRAETKFAPQAPTAPMALRIVTKPAQIAENSHVSGLSHDTATAESPHASTPETIASLLLLSKPEASEETVPIAGVRVRLDWNRDRVRRFVQVVDKLFTVDRLGWYRHVFAMRLLVPDVVICGDTRTDVEALRHLHALRAAAIETLGRPLLAAFMPNFAVTADWLSTLDKPSAARALAGLRDALLPFASEDAIGPGESAPSWTIAAIGKAELRTANASSIEALLPLFIPYQSPTTILTEKLGAYRSSLIEIFGQTTQSVDAVRLNQMAQINHALDDRLRQLAHSVSDAFGGFVNS